MKSVGILAVSLGAVLLLSVMPNLSYAESGIQVYAKEKQGLILLVVKNAKNSNIHELKVTFLDGTIDSAERDGWKVSKDSSNQVTLSSITAIPPNGREIFFIKSQQVNSIISWLAKDRNGSILGMDNARVVVRQTADSSDATMYMQNARIVTVTTDKVFYKKGEKMFISGVLDPNSKITITIYTPSGQKIKIGDQTDVIGNFKTLHVLHNAESGTYILKVSQPKATAETTFKVL
ncbi:MAG: T9SS type A sorting domain-containing protein [Nitrososphaerales archaeon]